MVNIEPTGNHTVPYNLDTEEGKNFHETVIVAANTADLLQELGASIEIEKDDIDKTLELFKASNRHVAKHALKTPSAASAAALFLRSYANQVATDAAEIRSAVTSKLMEIANCGDPRYELKALELLGKHSDVGLFTERSEITINHKTSSDLEEAIKERVKRLLNANIVDVTPITDNLDDELGVMEDEPRALLDELNEGDDESADNK
jgi:dsDNA-binding SOS-regulon protein